MNRVYNSGNNAATKTLSKALPTRLPGSINALTRGRSLVITLSGNIKASTRGKSLTIVGFTFVNQITTFQALFGLSSYQTNNFLFIKKSELFRLTPNCNNSAESLIVGLILLWSLYAKGKIDGKVSIDKWGIYLANGKIRYVFEANFYRQLTVISNEIQEINNALLPDHF